MDIVKLAKQLATEAHAGQFRWDRKTPYITHPEKVAQIAGIIYPEYFVSNLYYDQVIAVAWLHDVLEDCPEFNLYEKLRKNESISDFELDSVYDAVKVISKSKIDMSIDAYLNYIIRVKNNPFSRVVKIADITHNSSDLKKGSMRDKYRLAKYILES